MKKRIVSVVLIVAMLLSVLAACGGGSERPDVDKLDPETYEFKDVTITVSGKQGATDDWNDTVLVAKMKEKFGVTMDCAPFADDVWSTKFNLMLAEDTLPDLMVNSDLSVSELESYGVEDGYFLPIDEFLGFMPNLQAFFEEHPEYKAFCTSSDGHIYGLLKYNASWLQKLPIVFIKTSWLENVGLPYPETPDELYAVLKAFKEKDANGNGDPNDEIPMMWCSGNSNRTPEQAIMAMFGIQTANGNVYAIRTLDKDGKVTLADTTENYKAYLKFMNKLWSEGLIYNESYTATVSVQRTLTKADRVGIFSDAAPQTATGTGDPLDSLMFQYFGGFTSEYCQTPELSYQYPVSSTVAIAISAATQSPAEICRMIDYYFSDEGMMFGWRGDVKSYTDEVEVPGTNGIMYDMYRKEAPEGYATWEVYRHKKQVINGAFQIVNIATSDVEYMMEHMEDLDAIKLMMEGGFSTWVGSIAVRLAEADVKVSQGFPPLTFGEDSNRRNQLSGDISTYIKTMKADFITGRKNIDENWGDFIATMERMGLNELLTIEQAAYDRIFK